MAATPRIGVLVVQPGPPDAPTPAAVRRFLRQFLSDTRVADLNPVLWQIILRLFVLPRRAAALPGQGRREVAVMCPGFTADCLETLDEIGREAREVFEGAGGESFSVVPCLNSHPAWVEALAGIVRRESAGWV